MAEPQILGGIALAVVVTTVAIWAAIRPQPGPPPPIPGDLVEPWMAEALPGIGPRTAATIATQIRRGEPIRPPKAASAAALWFHRP